jgi:branched-chain amino acid transport system permease protein
MTSLGGLGTLAGPILGALVLEPTQQYFALQYGQSGYYLIVYGTLFLAIILLLPRGIIPTLQEHRIKYQITRSQQGKEKNEAVIVALSQPRDGGSAGSKKKEGVNL